MKKTYLKITDILIWVCLTVLTISTIAWINQGDKGNFVRITTPKGSHQIGLGTNQTFTVDGRDGPVTIRIEDKKARIIDSPCQRKLCQQVGAIDKLGQTIACLPEGVRLEIVDSNDSYDAVIP